MTTATVEGNTYTINADIKMFIVPNLASKFREELLDENHGMHYLVDVQEFAKINGKEFDPSVDRTVELWLTGEESLGSENLVDHGFRVALPDGDILSLPGYLIREMVHVPYSMIEDVEEGDTISVTFPTKHITIECSKLGRWFVVDKCKLNNDSAKDIDIVLHFNITAAQEEYRYRNFGTFEECLQRVMR